MSDQLLERVVAAIGDQYELLGEIGRGGMAVVYRARDRRLDRPVAIKILPPELAHDPAIRTRFAREAHTAAQLSHPHIVPIHDVGDRDGIAYFVMGLVTGGNLAARLARQPKLPIGEVKRLLCEIADALAYAHTRGVIHRDIKPDNILLDRDSGRAMVTDFGIARAMEAGGRLTATGIAVGTPTYMSPEQAVGEREVDGRSDLYSLGVLGYQMLTGRVPFSAGNSMALLLKHVTERPKPIGELRPDTPRAIREAIERALLKSPDDRWPTAAAFREALLDDTGPSWRVEREPLRYTSPQPDGARRERSPRGGVRAVAVRGGAELGAVPPPAPAPGTPVLVPEHLQGLTPEQRADLRLWRGRVHLLDRIKAARWHALGTVAAWFGSMVSLVAVAEDPDAFPMLVGSVIPIMMTRALWKRRKSLRAAGLRFRRVLLMPRAKWVLPAPPPPPPPTPAEELAQRAPREILDGPHGLALRQAAIDRAAILDVLGRLSTEDRALLPDLAPTVDALLERVIHVAKLLHQLDQSFDPRLIEQVDARIARAEQEGLTSPDDERRLQLLRRQRATLEEFAQRRAALLRQLDSAGLALGNLRLDLIKVQSQGLQAAFADVSSATQEARALSREIGVVLDAAAEARKL